jgi:hypothetical protein
MTAPSEYRSITGEASTPIAGVTIGGSFGRLASLVDRMAIVRSFAHGDSSHGTATQRLMTGYNDRNNLRPSLGSVMARAQGTTNPDTGMPSYVRMGSIRGDGPGWLGTAYSPFNPSGPARRNMDASVAADRIHDRRSLLNELDRLNRERDASGIMDGIDGFEQQAFELILGSARDAFDINKEDQKIRTRYGKGLGENLLKARRLCQTDRLPAYPQMPMTMEAPRSRARIVAPSHDAELPIWPGGRPTASPEVSSFAVGKRAAASAKNGP